jgi:exopolysaccharide biosynthesis polyprenyl glycosylphosphotransferase
MGTTMGRKNSGANTNVIYILSDIFFGLLSYIIAATINYIFLKENALFTEVWAICASIIAIYVISSKESRLYNMTTFFYADRFFLLISKSYVISLVISILLPYLTRDRRIFENSFFLLFFATIYYVMLFISTMINRALSKKTSFMAQRAIMIGEANEYNKFIAFLNKGGLNTKILGFVSFDPSVSAHDNYLGNVNDLVDIIQKNTVDQVFIMSKHEENIDTIQDIMDICRVMGVTTRLILNMYNSSAVGRYVSSIGTYPVMTYHAVTLNMSTRILKRIIDILGSLILLIVSSPIILITAIAIKLDSKGPVFFKQKRVGKNGRIFYMYKLRSMCNDAEAKKKELLKNNQMANDLMFKMSDDPRITKVGKFIRKTSIDELPQLFNVLKGDMSLVGTRPPTIDEVKQYDKRHWKRLVIWPGITGNWQVNGRSKITDFEKVVDLDVDYIDNWTIWLDFKILLKTVKTVLFKNDAY